MSYTTAIKWSIPCPERMAIIRLVGAVLARRTMNVLRAAVKWVSKSWPVPEDGKAGETHDASVTNVRIGVCLNAH
jgi:hypothetical protein